MTHGEFHAAVLIYCTTLRASQTSGYRTPMRNQAVDGHPDSKHMLGLAVDVVYDIAVPQARRETVARQLGLKLLIEGDHDHLAVP